jgi:hypothetical protein
MNGYTSIDVLKVYQKFGSLTLEELKKHFPDRHQSYSYLLECFNSLTSNDFIQNSTGGKYQISSKGGEKLRKLEEESEISTKLNLLQIKTLETELPLIQRKLKDYNIYKWISIISGIVSIVSVGILLITLLSHK